MKKIILFFIMVVMLVGCANKNERKLIDNLNDKIENVKNYQINAELEIFRNEEKYTYDVISTYKKDNYFKVDLINKLNSHQQIILKNKEAVYVLTPSLNKSFKFQSEWPFNNSQIYLLQPIISDVKKDENAKYEKNENGYTVISKVNYPTEKKFTKQKIYFDNEKNITKVEILDDDDNIKMSLKITNINYNLNLDDNYFDVDRYQNTETEEKDSKQESESKTTSLDEIVYPMYVPIDTYLTGQNIVNTEIGERAILTFSGESEFILVQENLDDDDSIGYIYGDPYLILDTVGAITDYSVSWISNNTEYSVMSDTMSIDELLTVAQSINVQAVGK